MTYNPHTYGIIADILQSNQESIDTAEMIAAWCDKKAGKRITEANTPEGWYLDYTAGMIHLQNEAYMRDRMRAGIGESKTNDNERFSFYLVGIMGANVWPTGDELRKHNPAYFEGAEKRNRQRRHELETGTGIARLAEAIDTFTRAMGELQDALPYDYPDRYAILKAVGLYGISTNDGKTSI